MCVGLLQPLDPWIEWKGRGRFFDWSAGMLTFPCLQYCFSGSDLGWNLHHWLSCPQVFQLDHLLCWDFSLQTETGRNTAFRMASHNCLKSQWLVKDNVRFEIQCHVTLNFVYSSCQHLLLGLYLKPKGKRNKHNIWS